MVEPIGWDKAYLLHQEAKGNNLPFPCKEQFALQYWIVEWGGRERRGGEFRH